MPVNTTSIIGNTEVKGGVAARNNLSQSHVPKTILASRPVSLYRVAKAIRPARKDGRGKPGPMHVDGGTDGAARLLFEASCGATFSRNQPRTPAKLQRKRSQPHKGALSTAPKRAGVWPSYQSDKTEKSKRSAETGTESVASSQPEHISVFEEGNGRLLSGFEQPLALADALSPITPWEAQSHPRGPPQSKPERSMSRDGGTKAARKPSLPSHPEEPASNKTKSAGCQTCQRRLTEEPTGYNSDSALQQMRPSRLPITSTGFGSDSAAHHPAIPTHSEVSSHGSDTTIRQSTFRKPTLTEDSGTQPANSDNPGHCQFPIILHRTEHAQPTYSGSGSHPSNMKAHEAAISVSGAPEPAENQLEGPLAHPRDTSSKKAHETQITTGENSHAESDLQSPDSPFHRSWIGGGSLNSIRVRLDADLPHNLLQPGSPTSSPGIHILPPSVRPQSAPPQNGGSFARPGESQTRVYNGPILQVKTPTSNFDPTSHSNDMHARLRKEYPVEIILTTPPPPPTPAWTPSPGQLDSAPIFPIPPSSTESPTEVSTPTKTNLRPRPLRASTPHLGTTNTVDVGTQISLPDLRAAESVRQRQQLEVELAALPAATYPWLSLSLVRQVRQTFETEFAVFQAQVDDRLKNVERRLEAQQLWFERVADAADADGGSDRTVKGSNGQQQTS